MIRKLSGKDAAPLALKTIETLQPINMHVFFLMLTLTNHPDGSCCRNLRMVPLSFSGFSPKPR